MNRDIESVRNIETTPKTKRFRWKPGLGAGIVFLFGGLIFSFAWESEPVFRDVVFAATVRSDDSNSIAFAQKNSSRPVLDAALPSRTEISLDVSPQDEAASSSVFGEADGTNAASETPKTSLTLNRSTDETTVSSQSNESAPESLNSSAANGTTVSLDDESTTAAGSKADSETTTEEKPKYDPIQENGEYFVGWEKPKIAIVLTGLLTGYIEPCGCAGMDRMKGGMSRRHSFIQGLKNQGWSVIPIDAGQTADGFGVQEELKFDMTTNAFRLMNYRAIGIGKSDLRFPAYFLLTFTAPPNATETSPFVCANVGIYGFNEIYLSSYKVIEENGCRVGVTSVVCPDLELQHRDENILIEDPAKKLREILPKLRNENCDLKILVVHGTETEALDLAKQFVDFDVVLTSDGPSSPPNEVKILNGKQRLIEVGEKGKYAIVLGVYDDPNQPIRYQRVALDSRFEPSPEIHFLMQEYQNILKTLITTKGYKEGLGLNSVESPRHSDLGEFVGSSKCESCHEESYRVWRRNRHSTAWNSLIETASPPRDFDPECVSCHVVGWQGVQNIPYIGGFVSEAETPQFLNVGCENCHGPGGEHLKAELGSDVDLQDSIRAKMRLGNNVKTVCFSCHDNDNSPDFDFDSYYKIIEHKESVDE